MTKEDLTTMVLMKIEANLALETFRKKYSKVSKGIEKIYEELILSNDLDVVNDRYNRLFGYIKKSKRAKDKWKDDDD